MRTDIRPDGTVSPGEVTTVDMKLEVVVIPVSDVDRAMRVTTRFPGRVDGDTTLASARDLAQALERAAAAHGDQGTPSTRRGRLGGPVRRISRTRAVGEAAADVRRHRDVVRVVTATPCRVLRLLLPEQDPESVDRWDDHVHASAHAFAEPRQ